MKTKQASAYLRTEHGEEVPVSTLEKFRMRGPDDPRDRGPDWTRGPDGRCDYTKMALDDYAARRRASRKLREPAPQPEQFRRAD
jgi:hypothetical protein